MLLVIKNIFRSGKIQIGQANSYANHVELAVNFECGMTQINGYVM